MSLARTLLATDELFILGADVMDGFYSESTSILRTRIATFATRLGVPSTILGCSFREKPMPGVVDAFRRLHDDVRVCARDPLSKRRFDRYLRKQSELVADLAFLLKSGSNYEFPILDNYDHWLMQQRRGNVKLVLGVNINTMPLGKEGHSAEQLIVSYIKAIDSLQNHLGRLAIIMLPHDVRNDNNDIVTCQSITSRLSSKTPVYHGFLHNDLSAKLLKAASARCDVVLTGRMHLAIGSLGSGVPPACIGYQDKFEGLFEHFGLNNMVISADAALNSDRLSTLVTRIALNRDTLKKQIKQALPHVIDLARANLEK